jgi:YegS/Rv2252/BmrU family lipid kinase
VLVVNTKARRGAAAFADARRLLEERGMTLDRCLSVGDPARLPDAVAQAVSEGHGLIVVGGGDGTISAAVNAIAGSGAICGLLPLGTANSFARSLHLPLDLDGAVDAIVHGRVREVDLGRINDRHFATTAAIGLSSDIQRRRPDAIKSLLGLFAYPAIAAFVLPRFKPFACTLTLDGTVHECPAALEVRIANAPYQGGVDAAPDASVTSGDLVVHIVTGTSKWRLIRTWGRIAAGVEPDGPGYQTFRAKRVRVEAEPVQWVNVDGEAALTTPIDVAVAHRALRVMVPR